MWKLNCSWAHAYFDCMFIWDQLFLIFLLYIRCSCGYVKNTFCFLVLFYIFTISLYFNLWISMRIVLYVLFGFSVLYFYLRMPMINNVFHSPEQISWKLFVVWLRYLVPTKCVKLPKMLDEMKASEIDSHQSVKKKKKIIRL